MDILVTYNRLNTYQLLGKDMQCLQRWIFQQEDIAAKMILYG